MEQPVVQKPSLAMLGAGILVIAGCTFTIAVAVAMLTVTWNPCSMISGCILLPLPSFVGIQQYRALFRASPSAAIVVAILSFFVAGVALFCLLVSVAEMLVQAGHFYFLTPHVFLGAVAASAAVAGWCNLHRSRQLKSLSATASAKPAKTRLSLGDLFAGITVVAGVIGGATYMARSTPPRWAEHVSLDKAPFGLPPTATDISFGQGHRGTIAFEFTTDERTFVTWVNAGIGSAEAEMANISLVPITTPYTIRRYGFLKPNSVGLDSTTISNGLYYQWQKEDRGVYAAFDRAKGRAYYFAHFH